MDIEVSFPGGKKVAARMGEFEILTDQPVKFGGQGSAPEPFALFLASLATCAGYYVLAFCQTRKIPTEGLKLVQRIVSDPEGKKPAAIHLDITVPPELPPKYDKAVVRVANQCAVKKALGNPPEIVIRTLRE